jgi:hypothetical protein
MKVAFLGLLSLLSISASTQIYVDIDAAGLNNGSSWSDAFTSLHDALEIAEIGNEIWVAEGRYVPDRFPRDSAGSPAMAERDYTFHLVNGVKLYGGFNATESLLSERNIDSNLTILSGEIDTVMVIFAYHVVLSVDDNEMTLLDGFTIRRGASFFPAPPPPITVEGILIERLNGCGISNYNSDPTLKNITFFENITFLDPEQSLSKRSLYSFISLTVLDVIIRFLHDTDVVFFSVQRIDEFSRLTTWVDVDQISRRFEYSMNLFQSMHHALGFHSS